MSTEFYTNVTQVKNQLYVRGYRNGKRFSERVNYKPYLFIPSNNPTEYKTLQGKYVEKLQFDNMYAAREFTSKYEDVSNFKIFGMSTWAYPYIFDKYGTNIAHDPKSIRVGNIDIEVMADGGFPNPQIAEKVITTITVRFKGKNLVFGHDSRPFAPKDKNTIYVKANSEEEMLLRFLDVWQNKLDLDVVTGWYCNAFDIPYIINRLIRLFDEKTASRLSPWGQINWRTIVVQGREQKFATLVGISILDYIELYQKFCPGGRESYTLDYIGKYENVDTKKLDYKLLGYKNLHDLWERNYQLYVEYNIDDVGTVDAIDRKLRLIALVITMSYNSGLNYADAMTTVRLWDVTIHGYLMKRNIVIPPQPKMDSGYGGIEGAYVKDPVPGMYKWVVSFDVNSLYPSLIRQCNISPESYVTTVPGVTVDGILVSYKDVRDPVAEERFRGTYYPNSQDREKHQNNKVGLCATGCLFDNEIDGFYPALMTFYYNERVKYQGLKKEANAKLKELKANKAPRAEIEAAEEEVSAYDMLQYSFKIMLNSAYGALSNAAYRWFDPKLSESVTKSGQLTIRWVERDINKYLNARLGTEGDKYVVYCDTDSAYICLEELVNTECEGMKRSEIVDYIDELCKGELQDVINKSFETLFKHMNHKELVLKMKREAIGSKAIWTAKKRYMMNVEDLEGERYSEPKLKMQGIEAVKSSTPSAARDLIKEGIKIILNGDQSEFHKFIRESREQFAKLPFEQVAFPRSCNNLAKYADSHGVYAKGCPIHVRGALVYNHLIRTKGLQDEIKMIQEGDKIKFAHMITPNPASSSVIATTGELPDQLALKDYIDFNKQFEKSLVEPLSAIAGTLKWTTESVPSLEDLFIY